MKCRYIYSDYQYFRILDGSSIKVNPILLIIIMKSMTTMCF